MLGSLLGVDPSRALWGAPRRIIIAGQSNALNIANATPNPGVVAPGTLEVFAVGGTSLHTDWQPGKTPPLHENLRNSVQSTEPNAGVMILWSQGETDQDNASATYTSDFSAFKVLVEGSRTDVLWAITLISKNTKYGARCTIRVAQEALCTGFSNCQPINTDDYAIQIGGVGDNLGVHYTNASAVQAWTDALQLAHGYRG